MTANGAFLPSRSQRDSSELSIALGKCARKTPLTIKGIGSAVLHSLLRRLLDVVLTAAVVALLFAGQHGLSPMGYMEGVSHDDLTRYADYQGALKSWLEILPSPLWLSLAALALAILVPLLNPLDSRSDDRVSQGTTMAQSALRCRGYPLVLQHGRRHQQKPGHDPGYPGSGR